MIRRICLFAAPVLTDTLKTCLKTHARPSSKPAFRDDKDTVKFRGPDGQETQKGAADFRLADC